ncbi:hypothetical protein [Cupriavidus sp. CuC1]|uniref:hypothetical protein n=1 Tax=Cupriavidus sp. CuC1 TaxID=3373131 RepID=UPI0037D71CF4
MSAPFARARAMFAAIAAAMALQGSARQLAMSAIGPYESRGKGKGRRTASRNTTAQNKRAAIKARNRAKHRRQL